MAKTITAVVETFKSLMLKVLSGSPMGFIKGTPDGYNYNTYPINVKMDISRGVAGGVKLLLTRPNMPLDEGQVFSYR